MNTLTLCRAQMLLKSLLSLSVALFGLLVSDDNIFDFATNWQFVHHVLAMDSMESWFNGAALRDRAITNQTYQEIFYFAIILGEITFGLLCAWGGCRMLYGTICNHKKIYNGGKIPFTLGCAVAVLVWYTGFAVIGAEYFSMWANQWNGQLKAYTFIGLILISLIYVSQPELAENAS
jgi:predicted small integral membrane protein